MISEVLIGVAVASVLGVLAWMVRKLSYMANQIDTFRDDWFGEPPRPGYSGRMGFPERLQAVEGRMGAIEGTIASIQYNTSHPKPETSHDEIIQMLHSINERINNHE